MGSSGSSAQQTAVSTAPTTAAPAEITTAATQAPADTPTAAPAATTVAAVTKSPQSALLTVNSAHTQSKIYTMEAKPGSTFLVINITVTNKNIKDGYTFTDNSISLSSPDAGKSVGEAITTKVRGGLNNPILTPTTIEMNDKRTGQIVFPIPMGASKHTLHLLDNKGVEISSETITV